MCSMGEGLRWAGKENVACVRERQGDRECQRVTECGCVCVCVCVCERERERERERKKESYLFNF